eukprot:10520769-Karenia_brevis.AAC.1
MSCNNVASSPSEVSSFRESGALPGLGWAFALAALLAEFFGFANTDIFFGGGFWNRTHFTMFFWTTLLPFTGVSNALTLSLSVRVLIRHGTPSRDDDHDAFDDDNGDDDNDDMTTMTMTMAMMMMTVTMTCTRMMSHDDNDNHSIHQKGRADHDEDNDDL